LPAGVAASSLKSFDKLNLVEKCRRLTRCAKSGGPACRVDGPHPTSSSQIKQLALNDVYGRLVLLFNEVSVPQGDGTRLIVERLTHKQIAGRLGCSREMVSRLIKDLEGRYLVVEDSHYRLLRPLPSRW